MKKTKKRNDNPNLIILLVLVLAVSLLSLYRYWQLDKNQTIIVVARIVDVYHDPNTGRGFLYKGQPAFVCEYTYEGKKYTATQHFQENQWEKINVGDCVEMEISTSHPRTCRWIKKEGVFQRNDDG